jgi:cytochrome b6-f complex iron-sulfur subunit
MSATETVCLHERCLSRRMVLAASGAGGVAFLAACSGDPASEATTAPDAEPTSDAEATSEGDATTSEGGGGGEAIATTADIPVGGAIAATTAAGEPILLTQPADGEIHAFSSVCTHQGCTVEPGDGELACPCHGSVFDLATGAPVQGPAADPLPEIPIEVADNGDITG